MSKSHGPRQAVTVLLQGKREERSRTVPAEEMSMNPNPVVINLAFSCVYHLTAPPFSKTRKIFLTRNTKEIPPRWRRHRKFEMPCRNIWFNRVVSTLARRQLQVRYAAAIMRLLVSRIYLFLSIKTNLF
jgi:hypothetical protein